MALSDDGGDELFGGDNRYFWGPRIWSHLACLPWPLRRLFGLAIQLLPLQAVIPWAARYRLPSWSTKPTFPRIG